MGLFAKVWMNKKEGAQYEQRWKRGEALPEGVMDTP